MSKEPEHFRGLPRPVSVAAIQMACDWDAAGNIARAERLVREAARQGAQVILLPELFETPYFCIEQDSRHLDEVPHRPVLRDAARQPQMTHILLDTEVRRLEQLWQQNNLRAAPGGLAHQLLRLGDVGIGIPAAAHLDGGDTHHSRLAPEMIRLSGHRKPSPG